jgi:RNA polymerase sigma factor (sigma-70 family)
MKTPVRGTDQAVLRQALSELHREAWAWALNCCDRNRQDAQDVLQTAYLKILEGRARFDGRSSMLTWLFAVVRKSALDLRRRRYVRDAIANVLGIEREDHAAASPESMVADAQSRRAVVAALRKLAHRQREVLLLVFYHELTVDEAAKVMGVSAGTARQHYARGKRALHTLLERAEAKV